MRDSEIVYLRAPPLRIDILRTADGIDTESTLDNAISVQLDGVFSQISEQLGARRILQTLQRSNNY